MGGVAVGTDRGGVDRHASLRTAGGGLHCLLLLDRIAGQQTRHSVQAHVDAAGSKEEKAN